ncbi:hypothetical protein NC651_015306 [Populus alba x Populus x berolinensis]|nr:hypothetical protein NC651_015306 [Populus alba x Populus x berolinensis]
MSRGYVSFIDAGVFNAHQERDSIARRITAASTASKSISLKCPLSQEIDDGPESTVGFARTKGKLKLPYSGAMGFWRIHLHLDY